MPAKVRTPAKPTFYLDHSTLCDAFRAHSLGGASRADSAYVPLLEWVEHVAREANLCLSVVHLAELARWGDHATADAMARWYEHLPTVWTCALANVQDAEDEHWTKIAAGVAPGAIVNPFAPSLLASFREMDGAALNAFLAQLEPTVAIVRALRVRGQDDFIRRFVDVAQRVREDRAWAESEGWSAERKRWMVEFNRRVDLRKRALEANRRLAGRGDSEYATKICSAGEVQDLLVGLYNRDARALPCLRAMQRFNEGLIAFAMNRTAPSNKEQRALAGSFHDMEHVAIGAAYCEVFTCDSRVDGWLGDLREQFCLRRQLSVGTHASGPAGFVADLLSSWSPTACK